MSGLLRSLRAESYRLLRTRSVWGCALFLAAVSVLRVLLGSATRNLERAEAVARGATVDEASGAGWALLVDGWRSGLAAGGLLLLLQAARTLAADRESGVLCLSITRASSRGAVVLARALLGVPLVLGVFCVTGLAAWLAASASFDFGPLVENDYEIFSAEELADELALASLASLPALLTTWTFGLFLSAALRSGTGAMTVAVSVFLSFDLFKEALGEAQYLVFAAFAPSFVDGSWMSEMSGVARGYSDAGYAAAIASQNWVVPWPQAALFLALAIVFAVRRPA